MSNHSRPTMYRTPDLEHTCSVIKMMQPTSCKDPSKMAFYFVYTAPNTKLQMHILHHVVTQVTTGCINNPGHTHPRKYQGPYTIQRTHECMRIDLCCLHSKIILNQHAFLYALIKQHWTVCVQRLVTQVPLTHLKLTHVS